jgi:hypothetical protein
LGLNALIIGARQSITEGPLKQIKENPDLQFFIGLEALQYFAPFDPSIMAYCESDYQNTATTNATSGLLDMASI